MSVIALDLGGTKIRGGIVSGPTASSVREVPTPTHDGARGIVRAMAEIISDLHQIQPEANAVGIAAAGVIKDGRVVSATDLLPGWAGTEVSADIQYATGLSTTTLGDVHAHGLGEAVYGGGQGFNRCLTVAVGTGVGGALVVNKVVDEGAHGLAGHIGHIASPRGVGITCSCGRQGHMEPVASGPGIAARYAEFMNATSASTSQPLDVGAPSGKDVAHAARDGDFTARRILSDAGFALGEAIGGAANLLDPDVVLLSGSVAQAPEPWWSSMKFGFDSSAMDLARSIDLRMAALGDNAPLIGAGYAATHEPHTAVKVEG